MQQQNSGAVDADREAFETITAGLIKHIFGAGEKGIRDKLSQSQDLAMDIGSLAFTMTEQGVMQAKDAGVEMDMDILFGVATEVIDSLLQLSEAMGLIEDADDQGLKEDTLTHAVQAYLTLANPSDEEREAAKQLLDEMSAGGQVDEAAKQLQSMGKRHGVDPFAGAPVDAAAGAQQPAAQPPRPALMQE